MTLHRNPLGVAVHGNPPWRNNVKLKLIAKARIYSYGRQPTTTVPYYFP